VGAGTGAGTRASTGAGTLVPVQVLRVQRC
jgi:hypothetical protein